MYTFIGKNTQGREICEVSYSNHRELYEQLVDKDVISIADGCPIEDFLIEKFNVNTDEFYAFLEGKGIDIYDYIANELGYGCKAVELSELEYLWIIQDNDGNTYYQEFDENYEY